MGDAEQREWSPAPGDAHPAAIPDCWRDKEAIGSPDVFREITPCRVNAFTLTSLYEARSTSTLCGMATLCDCVSFARWMSQIELNSHVRCSSPHRSSSHRMCAQTCVADRCFTPKILCHVSPISISHVSKFRFSASAPNDSHQHKNRQWLQSELAHNANRFAFHSSTNTRRPNNNCPHDDQRWHEGKHSWISLQQPF